MEEQLTFNDYLKIGMIYSGLTKEEVLLKAREAQKAGPYKEIIGGLFAYIRSLDAPVYKREHTQAILSLERKLSDLEMKALTLKEECERKGETGIQIILKGINQE